MFFSIFNFLASEYTDIISSKITRSSIAKDKERIKLMAEAYENILNTRKDSQRLANDIIAIGRNPLSRLEAPLSVPILSSEPSVRDLEDLPPIIIIRAVMIFPGRSSAVLDIDGVGEGVVVKKGTRFLGKKGRVLSISKKKFIYSWNGKRITVPIDI